MRSTWISGFYRFSTRKAGSLDIFRFRISRSDDFGIGPFLESNPPPTTVKPSGNVDPGITEIKTSFKFKRRDSKGGLHATTVNPSRARYAFFAGGASLLSMSCVQTLKPAIPNGIPAVPVSGSNAKIPMTENCVSFGFPLYRDGKTA